MARPGVGMEKITEAIREIEAQGQEPTVTAVRERLGSGSFSTIGIVLSDWRQKKESEARPAVPEPPDLVRIALGNVWSEAWKAANGVLEPERQSFARERQEHDRARAEMNAEIARLETELEAERERGAGAARDLASERDRYRGEAETTREALVAAERVLDDSVSVVVLWRSTGPMLGRHVDFVEQRCPGTFTPQQPVMSTDEPLFVNFFRVQRNEACLRGLASDAGPSGIR